MAPKGTLWEYFYQGQKQNTSQYRAHCWGCLEKQRPSDIPIDLDTPVNPAAEAWFQDATATTGSVLGVKSSMLNHLLTCENASANAKAAAKREKKGKSKRTAAVSDDNDDNERAAEGDDEGPSTKKRKLVTAVKKEFSQQKLHVFKGLNIPFSDREKSAIEVQFGRATISANLPFQWVNDPEVLRLFMMFRAKADEVIPDWRQVVGRILDSLATEVDTSIHAWLKGAYVSIS
ncbi:hypothetical protein BDZ89DRAFT_967851 [Hymenopellis radicata]|nr:hypothetical protein BDZ89DRAFT_967851 [Hymenopellis radicata]